MGSVIFNLECTRKPYVGQSLLDPLPLVELTAFPDGYGEGTPGWGQGCQVGEWGPRSVKGQRRQGEKDEERKGGKRKEEEGKREKIPYWHLFLPTSSCGFYVVWTNSRYG